MLSATHGPMPHHSIHAQPSGQLVQYMLNGTGIHLAEHARQDTSNTCIYTCVMLVSFLTCSATCILVPPSIIHILWKEHEQKQ